MESGGESVVILSTMLVQPAPLRYSYHSSLHHWLRGDGVKLKITSTSSYKIMPDTWNLVPEDLVIPLDDTPATELSDTTCTFFLQRPSFLAIAISNFTPHRMPYVNSSR